MSACIAAKKIRECQTGSIGHQTALFVTHCLNSIPNHWATNHDLGALGSSRATAWLRNKSRTPSVPPKPSRNPDSPIPIEKTPVGDSTSLASLVERAATSMTTGSTGRALITTGGGGGQGKGKKGPRESEHAIALTKNLVSHSRGPGRCSGYLEECRR